MIKNWKIPAKTFLLGEYSALIKQSALILTTYPCFEISLYNLDIFKKINMNIPYKILWNNFFNIENNGINWSIPYLNIKGIGESSAKFIGIYLIYCYILSINPSLYDIMNKYYNIIETNINVIPSGYDIISQTKNNCVYINYIKKTIRIYNWPFKNISFILLRGRKKIQTFNHLKTIKLNKEFYCLSYIVDQAMLAFDKKDEKILIDSINDYQKKLEDINLMSRYSKNFINLIRAKENNILAIKGCGALGSDVLLIIVPTRSLKEKIKNFTNYGWNILATNQNLYSGNVLIKDALNNTL